VVAVVVGLPAGGRGRSNEDIIIIVENGRVRGRLAATRTGRPRSKMAAGQWRRRSRGGRARAAAAIVIIIIIIIIITIINIFTELLPRSLASLTTS